MVYLISKTIRYHDSQSSSGEGRRAEELQNVNLHSKNFRVAKILLKSARVVISQPWTVLLVFLVHGPMFFGIMCWPTAVRKFEAGGFGLHFWYHRLGTVQVV